MIKRGKRGNILTENVIFIVLNIIYITILIAFISNQGSGAVISEQVYAKQIALLIDSAKPGMILTLNMESVFEDAKKQGMDLNEIVKITNNMVTVTMENPERREGQSYYFFNNVSVDKVVGFSEGKETYYIFTVREK